MLYFKLWSMYKKKTLIKHLWLNLDRNSIYYIRIQQFILFYFTYILDL